MAFFFLDDLLPGCGWKLEHVGVGVEKSTLLLFVPSQIE